MKKIICFVLMVLMVCCLCSCSVEESTNQSNNTLPPSSSVRVWTDEETGVQYIIYEGYKQGGIYPRLNADGSLHIARPTEKGGE
jgi:maltose-binding protein MalE